MSVRVGLVGTSGWSEFMYLQNLQGFELGQIVALAARNRDRLSEIGAKYGIELLYTDWREMFDKANIDAVIVASPDSTHKDIVLAALGAGIHVLCEKPLAMNSEDAQMMFDAAQASKVINNVMFTWRDLEMHREIKRLLDANVAGRVLHFDIRFAMGWASGGDYTWRLDAEKGNGSVGDLGVHDIDLVRWMFGEISTVYCEVEESIQRFDADGNPVAQSNDSSTMLLELESGAKGVITTSAIWHQGDRVMDQRMMVYGTEASIEATLNLDGPNAGMKLAIMHKDGQSELVDLGIDVWSRFGKETIGARAFVENVKLKRQAGPDFGDGFAAQVVVDAALRSSVSHQRIVL